MFFPNSKVTVFGTPVTAHQLISLGCGVLIAAILAAMLRTTRLGIDMRAELKHLQHELSVVTIYVTHDQVEAMTLASRIAILKDGVLQQYDTPSETFAVPRMSSSSSPRSVSHRCRG